MINSSSTSTHIIKEFETNQVLKSLLPKLQSIEKTKKPPRVTVLPDFFVDRIIEVTDHSKFVSETEKKIKAELEIPGMQDLCLVICMALRI